MAITYGFAGFGPRHEMEITDFIIYLCTNKPVFDQLREQDSEFSIQIKVYEKLPKFGGNAFQKHNDATINSGVSPSRFIGNRDAIPERLRDSISRLTDLRLAIKQFYAEPGKRNAYLKRICSRNLAAVSMWRNHFNEDSGLDASKPCLTRGGHREVQEDCFLEALSLAREELPFLSIEMHYSTAVVDVDLANAGLLIREPDAKTATWQYFDYISIGIGTTFKQPVPMSVAQYAFYGTPNADAIDKHVGGGLKDAVINGASLSAYDYATLLLTSECIFDEENNGQIKYGIKINEDVAAESQRLLTFINRHAGEAAPPKHSHDTAWHFTKPFLTYDQAHAVTLQHNYDGVTFLRRFVHANGARALGKTPGYFTRKLSTRERMEDYSRQNEQHLSARTPSDKARTECGVLRIGWHTVTEGTGCAQDPKLALEQLEKNAPLTTIGRKGYPQMRRWWRDISDPEYLRTHSNVDAQESWAELLKWLTASPVEVQQMVALAFKHGVADHIEGSFGGETYCEADGKFEVGGRKFSHLFAPGMITNEGSLVHASIAKQAKLVVPGQPEMAKGRFYRARDGSVLRAREKGLGGHGAFMQDGTGSRSLAGRYWEDTNSHFSASITAPISAYLRMCMTILYAKGEKNAVDIVEQCYREQLPTEEEYDNEVRAFEADWDEVLEQYSFLGLCEQLAGQDEEKYLRYTDQGFSRQTRSVFLEQQRRIPEAQAALTSYSEEKDKMAVAFDPVSRDGFYDRSVDYTPDEIKNIFSAIVTKYA